MNCLEFRRAALANPHHPGHEALAHEAECTACARFYRDLRQQEEDLYEAMRVPVPEGLSDRILLRRARGWREWFSLRVAVPALAASLTLAGALGVGWTHLRALPPENLAAEIAVHVADEPKALAARMDIPRATLASLVQRSGGTLIEAPGTTTYADRCPLPGGGKGEHIVFDTAQGKITLILMPGKALKQPVRLDKNGWSVSLMPAGKGSLALVVPANESIGRAEAWAHRNLRWPKNRT